LSEQAFRKAASQPQAIHLLSRPLECLNRAHIEAGNPSRQRFTALLHQVKACRAKKQKVAGALTLPPSLVNNPAQDLKKSRHALDFVKDHKLAALLTQVTVSVLKSCSVGWPLQVKIACALGPLLREDPRQRRLADLAGSKKHHSRRLRKAGA